MGKKDNVIKYKSDLLLEELSTRWINGDYKHFAREFKSNKCVAKKHPKIGELYDFRNFNLRKTRLSNVEVKKTCFDNSKGYESVLTLCKFDDSELNNVDFEKSIIRESKFLNCKMEDCNFQSSEFYNVKLGNSNLTKCNFKNSKFIKLDITDAVLDYVDLSNIEVGNEDGIIGIPKSMKGLSIDRLSFMYLNKEIKQLILKEGNIIDNSFEEYDVALSFAGENRSYVEKVAEYLDEQKIKVFYDDFEKVDLWGKELIGYLTELYSKKAKYVIIFVSEYYNNKAWTNVERIATLSKILDGKYNFILPVMLEETSIVGLTNSKGYLDGQKMKPEEIGECFLKKFISDYKI